MMYKNKSILVSGGTGSWGQELTKQLLEFHDPKEIIIYSRGEFAQVLMKRKFNNKKLKFVIGDVRDYNRLNESMKNVDFVFHLAALKHVPICEEHILESIKTNIIGVQNIVNCAINNNVKMVVDLSTDKACNPLNVYGICKSLGEKIIIDANKNKKTKFVCIRSGNVIGTNGSIIPYFVEKAKNKETIPITDISMTRFLIPLREAIKLVLSISSESQGGEIFALKMSSAKIIDIANVLWKFYNPKDAMKKNIIGIREGEKLNETLVSEQEMFRAVETETHYTIYPHGKFTKPGLIKDLKEYTSNINILNEKEIMSLLKNGGWI